MKVKHILEALHGLDDNDQVMITFFLKEHADDVVADDKDKPLTIKEWEKAVEQYERNKYIDQVVSETYGEIIYEIVKERVKK